MEETSLVNVSVLRDFVCSILDKVERDYGEVVAIDQGLYWDLSQEDRFDMTKEPRATECGSLLDDWGFVLNAAKSPEEAIPLMLLHVAPILQMLATSIPSYPDQTNKESL